MKKLYLIKAAFIVVLIFSGFFSSSQCPAGSTTATVNWDNLDYLSQTGTYATFVTTAMMQTQKFTIGKNRLSINFPGTISTKGENTTNTAETGSFGTGADVEYSGNGDITITFDTVVYNLQFSLYDIDSSQTVKVTAIDGSATPVPLNVTMSVLTAGVATISGSGGTAPTATANATAILNTDTKGTLNISVAGDSPVGAGGVKKVTITMGGAAGNYWLSDLTACVFGSFPINYFASQKPWNGQPGYFMVTPDNNSVYQLNPLTGQAIYLFTEPASQWVNSLAYDPVNHILYYVMDNPSPVSTNKSIKKYDFNTETISTLIPDVTTLGIPLFDIVVESAGAAFYNGSLFLGIEGTNSTKTSNRESIIWRIDFDATLNPIRAAQVYARPADNGTGTLSHDWGDFTIKDGVLYDFNTGNVGTTSQFVHFDMQTGNSTNFNTNGSPAPIQAGQTWDGTIYWTGGQSPETGRVAKYNQDGTIGAKITIAVTPCSPAWVSRAGDASDPFRPKSDFGDAPASYDPVGTDKATHEYDCNLRLGATFDREWDKTPSADASADGTDEDGISTVTILSSGLSNYVQAVKVYNNTGANVVLGGWLDYNGNGVFDPGEGRTVTVPTNAAIQTITLSWLGITTTLSSGSHTFLRIRVTSSAMTVNNPTGWFANGEVEDYMVPIDIVLPVRILSFTAVAEGKNTVKLNWITGKEVNFQAFDIERSTDGVNWNKIGSVDGYAIDQTLNSYAFYDQHPVSGRSYYRLSLIYVDGSNQYSEVRVIESGLKDTWVKINPNPVHDHAAVQYSLDKKETVSIYIVDASGRKVLNSTIAAEQGLNQLNLNGSTMFKPGVYIVKIITASEVMTAKMIVQ